MIAVNAMLRAAAAAFCLAQITAQLASSNPCAKNPCEHGICVVNRNSSLVLYHCYCEDGYTGINCGTDWNECWSDPCLNGATCLDLVANFNCTCPSGFTGALCETNIDECLSQPCLYDGQCTDHVDGYSCQCQSGFRGDNCEIDVSVCNVTSPWSNLTEDKKCRHGGTCIDGLGTDFSCDCSDGWSGEFCETDIDECIEKNPCLNGGMCMNMEGSYICSCPFGYAGPNCEVELEKCDSNPCENDALCFLVEDEFHCYCVPDYHGPRCQFKYDDCQLPPIPKCQNDGQCVDGVDEFACQCPEGFIGPNCQCAIDDSSTECQALKDIETATVAITPQPTPASNISLEQDVDYDVLSTTTESPGTTTPQSSSTLPTLVDNLDAGLPWPELEPSDGDHLLIPHLEIPIEADFSLRIPIIIQDPLAMPASTIIYSDGQDIPPATSVFIYEPSSSDLVTRSFLAGEDIVITNQSSGSKEDRGLNQDKLEPSFVIQPTGVLTTIPVTVISQSSLEVISTRVTPKPDMASVTPTPESSHVHINTSDPDDVAKDITTSSNTTPDLESEEVTFFEQIVPLEVTTPDTGVGEAETTLGGKEAAGTTVGAEEALVFEGVKGPATIKYFDEANTTEGVQVTETVEGTEEANATEGVAEAEATSSPTEADTTSSPTEAETTSSPEEAETTEGSTPTTTLISTAQEDTATDASVEQEISTSQGALTPLPDDQTQSIDESTQPSEHTDEVSSLATFSNISDQVQCVHLICKNGGVCLSMLAGARCHCPLRYRGAQCEEEFHVSTPGFLGHSLLVHKLQPNASLLEPFSLLLTFQTSSPVGVIFFTTGNTGHLKLIAYLDTGILHLRVNCGPQHILFAEPSLRVDSGFVQNLEVTVSLADMKCVTVIRLNDTHAMRGEQEIEAGTTVPDQPDVVYFGQMPTLSHTLENDELFVQGFQGCMKHLQINGLVVDLYQDADSGRDVVECRSAICALQPCQNGAICTEHETSGSWFCNCPPGFTGPLCERLVCDTNPCHSGGTCMGSKVGPGFICLCPLGYVGALCETSMNITQPAFTTSVGGYSSYMAYGIHTLDVSLAFECQFHFTIIKTDQIALLFFMGEHGLNGFGSDYVALSYVKGHVLLTWDLGSGPRRIFTTHPIDSRYIMHSVRFGRHGRRGWLQVDQSANITGKAPGSNEFLNASSKFVFVGGHEIHNFTFLPHDLPVHRGFEGCIFDFSVSSSASHLPLVPLHSKVNLRKTQGRNIHQCHVDICSSQPCHHGGTCIGYGASFTCSCSDGWFGVLCQEETSLCTTGKHRCGENSECALHLNGTYFCKCPFGQSGNFCTETLDISDGRFSTPHSQLWLNLSTNLRQRSTFGLDIKPESRQGMLLYVGQSRDFFNADFFSLSLQNGTLVLSLSLGGPRSALGNVLALSLCCIKLNEWNQIEAGRIGRDAFLRLNGQNANGQFQMNLASLDVDPTLYLGNAHNRQQERHSLGDLDLGLDNYQGCLRNVQVNGQWLPLRPSVGWRGWDVVDCDGTVCGMERCQRRGSCDLNEDKSGGFECHCNDPFQGRECEVHQFCEGSDGCQNGASCEVVNQKIKCNCPLGFEGSKCHQSSRALAQPQFQGDGYLVYTFAEMEAFKDETRFSFDMKTNQSEAILLWIGQDVAQDDYLGVGLRDGRFHVVWNLGWLSRSELTVPGTFLNDMQWHTIAVHRQNQHLEIRLDGAPYSSRVTGSFSELNVQPSVYLGGSYLEQAILDLTRGHFEHRFMGCLARITLQGELVDLQSMLIQGSNVLECSNPAA